MEVVVIITKLEINGNPIEVEDVIYAMVGGDFSLGNAIKVCS